MKKVVPALAGFLAVSVAFSLTGCGGFKYDVEAPAFDDADATIALSGSLDKRNRRISGDLFGLFLEDINFASYALDDNYAVNGSFEYDVTPTYGWNADGVAFSVATENAVYATNPHYLSLNVTKAGGTLGNTGYQYAPLAVDPATDYVFSAFFRSYSGEVTVSVKGNDGTVYGETTFAVDAPDGEWIKYRRTLRPDLNGDKNLKLEIAFGSTDSDVLLDAVSFETTSSTGGIKNYIYEAIKDLSPAFFRFPGGCIIEGKNDNSYYDWKNSIGAVKKDGKDEVEAFSYTLNENGKTKTVTTYGEASVRTPNTDIWQYGNHYYEMEYGLGFYEYFLLCDSLGAKAVPVVNCGKSCQTQGTGAALKGRHNNGVDDFIRDAIDLIYFAKGDVKSSNEAERYWANVRKNMGHAKPFAMDYIGIGNEQWGDYYSEYYERFLANEEFMDALFQFEVKPIVGNCTMFEHCENPEAGTKGLAQTAAESYLTRTNHAVSTVADYGLVDQHYYVNYTDFFANTHLYDNYKRKADDPEKYYEVFVGEYSANSTNVMSPVRNENVKYEEYFLGNWERKNTWMTALSEAAMMTGFERNGDIVRLAAYAPMFGNHEYNQWQVDMMYFTNTQLMLTPNYYVQQLFMKNAGDFGLDSELTFTSGVKPTTVHRSTGAATRELDDVYYVTTLDEETGDIIVKIVNAGAKEMKFNIDASALSGANFKGYGYVTALAAENPKAVSTLKDGSPVTPETVAFGKATGKVMGYTAPAYSLTAIRLKTK